SLEYLEMVNKHAKKPTTRGAAWQLRAELIAHKGTLDEVNEYGKQRVTEEGG
ncbi:MAG TPA: HNH endonuclease, partial [Corynebacterium stationis]|nr:HNH endonuclease [Corynebacterium stationis]